ncbi:hypothetical protein TWF506_008029 [Arthrobotrys conoides]|uniref:Uncharacterized protein n=1 Tax=Arthrobotrys conoides TaxID=74498 RepID=A0AAN8NII7_9PEZI
MTKLFPTWLAFVQAIEDWYPYPSRAFLLYPNHPAEGNPNFAPAIPPNPIERLCINTTTAGSLIVAIEEYQSITWRFRPTAWPSMPHDKRQISDIKFHMTALLQTMRNIIPDDLHEVPGPLKETMDCLAQSLIRLESINPDIRGQWRIFNDVSSHTSTSSNTYQEILNLTNMKLRQLKDKAIGDTFPSPIEDREAQSAADMIIESTTNRQENVKPDSTGKRSSKIWGIPINFNIFRKRKDTASEPSKIQQPHKERVRLPISTSAPNPYPWWPQEIPPGWYASPKQADLLPPVSASVPIPCTPEDPVIPDFPQNFFQPGSQLSFIALRDFDFNIPYRTGNTPVGSPDDAGLPYSPVSKNATVPPIRIGTPSSSPTHVAIREAAQGYRRKKALEVRFQQDHRRYKSISRGKMAKAAARRIEQGLSSPPPDPISGVAVGEAQHIENVGFQAPRPRTPKPPPRVQTTRPKPSKVRVRAIQARPTGGDDENVPRAPTPAAPHATPALQSQPLLTRADFAKQVVPKTGSNPVSLLSLRAC